MTILITNTTVVTCDAGRRIHYNAALAVDGDRISDIGPSAEVESKFPNAECIDGRGKVVFPGLVNCHTHLLATADRGILEDFGFPTTLRFPTTGRGLLDKDGRNVFGLLGALEAIRSGTTTMLEISNDIPSYADSLSGTGMRLFLAENFNDIDDAEFAEGGYAFSSGEVGCRVKAKRGPDFAVARG